MNQLQVTLAFKATVNHPTKQKKDRDLNQGVLHFGSKYGDPSFNGDELHKHTRTHRESQAMMIPGLG